MTSPQQRTVIRITDQTLIFARKNADTRTGVDIETYIPKGGISMAAHLREALPEIGMLDGNRGRVLVLIESPAMPVPIEEYDETAKEEIYCHSFDLMKNHEVMHSVIPELKCAVLFQVSKDLRLVLGDNFPQVSIMPLMQPLWAYLYRRSQNGLWRKLYAYFHEKRMELFCYDKSRFRFCNQFDARHTADNVFYTLYAWQQMGLNSERDELHLLGSDAKLAEMGAQLKPYIQKVAVVDAATALGPSPVCTEKQLPIDLMPLFID